MPPGELVAQVKNELADLLGISGEPVVARTRQWPRGLPHYTIGHDNRRKIIETSGERIRGLYLTGNYLDGVSIANCLVTAQNKCADLCRDFGAAGDAPLQQSHRI